MGRTGRKAHPQREKQKRRNLERKQRGQAVDCSGGGMRLKTRSNYNVKLSFLSVHGAPGRGLVIHLAKLCSCVKSAQQG